MALRSSLGQAVTVRAAKPQQLGQAPIEPTGSRALTFANVSSRQRLESPSRRNSVSPCALGSRRVHIKQSMDACFRLRPSPASNAGGPPVLLAGALTYINGGDRPDSSTSRSSLRHGMFPQGPAGRHNSTERAFRYSHIAPAARESAAGSTSSPFSFPRELPLFPVARPRFERLGECLVCVPPRTSRGSKRGYPKAIITFIGGAFVGAAPDVFYSYFLGQLSRAGYMVVAVPHNISFDHVASAARIHARLLSALQLLSLHGLPAARLSPADVADLPLFGVGHSFGALMHLLLASLPTTRLDRLPDAIALIAFNNRPASFAVPFFDQLGPAVKQIAPLVDSFPLSGIALSLAEQAAEVVTKASGQLPYGIAADDVAAATRFAEQIPPVLGEVRDGASEFTPAPADTRKLIAAAYSIPQTLLVRFTVDSIDETDSVEPILRARTVAMGGSLSSLLLAGTHATPLAPDLVWPVGGAYSPADALAQSLKSASLTDVRTLVRALDEWFDAV